MIFHYFPNIWENNPHVPNHQPVYIYICILYLYIIGILCQYIYYISTINPSEIEVVCTNLANELGHHLVQIQ
jgi:hypothetical protein